uniref:C2H2-type domain-containing protein n=1 Tax=Amphora coffeiformis TaxID=265554 RepID=A0A7S3PD32_9STRA|mmetsp:Transcript_10008/g.19241  ORF Transcript_10008/g.19241 Transcript_10008/m.19241 type:complete len:208 (+) Transcript_10008:74-697(+)|eukprot:scaffold17685_cov169-Amphora_coffeaeformis.AAC.1
MVGEGFPPVWDSARHGQDHISEDLCVLLWWGEVFLRASHYFESQAQKKTTDTQTIMCYSNPTAAKPACAVNRQGPFVCDICGATYHNDEHNLELHKKIMHQISSAEEDKKVEKEDEDENNLVDNAFQLSGKSLRYLESSEKEEKGDDGFEHGVVWRRCEPCRYGAVADRPKGSRPGLLRWMSCTARLLRSNPARCTFRAPSDTFWLV